MNLKGQLGSALTLIPVLILVFVIMLIFVIIAGAIGAEASVSEESSSQYEFESINSRVLLEMFLGDYVLIDGDETKIEEAILKIPNEKYNSIKQKQIVQLIQDRFHEKYGCEGTNELQIMGEFNTGEKIVFIDYPLVPEIKTITSSIAFTSGKRKEYLHFMYEDGNSKKTIPFKHDKFIRAYARGNVLC